MSAAVALRTYLLGTTAISNLIGTRCFPNVLPQNCTLPAVVYHVISATHAPGLAGIVDAGECRVQLDCHAATRLAADGLSAAIVTRLKTLSAAGPTSIGTGTHVTKVCDVEISGPRDDQQPPADGSDEWTYISSVDAVLSLG